MDQIKKIVTPFDNPTVYSVSLQIFLIMPNGLISAGKLVKADNTIILDDPEALVVNKITKEVIMRANFYECFSAWNVHLDRPIPYKFIEPDKNNKFYSSNNKSWYH